MPDPLIVQFFIAADGLQPCLDWLADFPERRDDWSYSAILLGEEYHWQEGYEFTFYDLGFGTQFKLAFNWEPWFKATHRLHRDNEE